MIDYSASELQREKFGFGDSVGPAQITADTLIRENAYDGIRNPYQDFTQDQLNGMFNVRWPDRSYITQQLIDPTVNIDAAAHLIKNYLNKLCSAAVNGTMSASFKTDMASGCNINDFCCAKGKSCKDIVNYNVPACLIQAMGGIWNNGPKLIQVNDIPIRSPKEIESKM